MPKERVPIPREVSAKVLFEHDHTCCVCNTPGKSVQIHHLNEDPADNRIDNFAVLCLDDHDRTQVRGGFGRHLSQEEVIEYRNDWLARVKRRRNDADKLSVYDRSEFASKIPDFESVTHIRDDASDFRFASYIKTLPELRRIGTLSAREMWDYGTNAQMREGNSSLITLLEQICVRLSELYPPNHFGNTASRFYFSELTASLYQWAYSIYVSDLKENPGTMVSVMAGGLVIDKLADRISDLVDGIYFTIGRDDLFDPIRWRNDWRRADKEIDRHGFIRGLLQKLPSSLAQMLKVSRL